MSVIGKTNVYIVPQGSVKCLSFNGVNDYVGGTIRGGISNSALTVGFWLYMRPSKVAFQHPFGLGSGHGWTYYNYYLNNFIYFKVENEITGAYIYETSIGQIGWNKWVHIATTWDGNAYYAYLNGTRIGYTTSNGPVFSSNNFTIGNSGLREFANSFNGLITEVRVYNRALSDTEITTLYNGGDVWNGLVLYLPGYGILEDQNKWWDFSGNNNHGSLINGPKVVWDRIR